MDRKAYKTQAKQWSCIFTLVISAFISLLISFISVPDQALNFEKHWTQFLIYKIRKLKDETAVKCLQMHPPCLSRNLPLRLLGMDFLPAHRISSNVIYSGSSLSLWPQHSCEWGQVGYVTVVVFPGIQELIGSECRTTAATLLQLQEHKSTRAPFLFLGTDLTCFYRKWR